MTVEQWRTIERLFHELTPLPATGRAALLRDVESEIRREVEILLAHGDASNADIADAIQEVASDAFEDPMLGTTVSHYKIESLLGRGAMGVVYKAHDLRLDRFVALKFLDARALALAEARQRFIAEAKAASALDHPNVGTIYEIDEAPEGHLFIAMAYYKGDALSHRIGRGPLAVSEALQIAIQIGRGLAAAHARGIVHRDVKPSNVLILDDGAVKVIDFGVAKISNFHQTATGVAIGTPAYMAPEQILGRDVDHRADIWATGVILYQMLTGKSPFNGNSMIALAGSIVDSPPPPLAAVGASPGVESLLMTMLAKSPSKRYQNALDFVAAAERLQQELRNHSSDGVGVALASPTAQAGTPEVSATSSTFLISIAVLPFVFLNALEGDRALSLGFADALITMLCSLEDVTVAPTSTVLKYTPGVDPATVCHDLSVRYALQGNVQKLGARWRVSIQLFDTSKHKVTFSSKHDFTSEDVFDIQDEIGSRVVEALKSRFPLAAPRSRDRYSDSPDAYEAFMTGLRDSYSDRRESTESAIRNLSASIEFDPAFALAHAALSHMCATLYYSFDPHYKWLDKAEFHCNRALQLNPHMPEALLARAWILWSPAKNFQHIEAIATLEEVLALQPNLERAHNRMCTICLHIGRIEEARKAYELAQQSNPRTKSYNIAYVHLFSGDFEAADQVAAEWIRHSPDGTYALWVHPYTRLLAGDLDTAEERLTNALKAHPAEPLLITMQGMLHARRRESENALACIRRAQDSPRSFGHSHHTYYHIACIYAELGDLDRALDWLNRSAETGNPCWSFFKLDPFLENVRADARFQRLVSDLELKYATLRIDRL